MLLRGQDLQPVLVLHDHGGKCLHTKKKLTPFIVVHIDGGGGGRKTSSGELRGVLYLEELEFSAPTRASVYRKNGVILPYVLVRLRLATGIGIGTGSVRVWGSVLQLCNNPKLHDSVV